MFESSSGNAANFYFFFCSLCSLLAFVFPSLPSRRFWEHRKIRLQNCVHVCWIDSGMILLLEEKSARASNASLVVVYKMKILLLLRAASNYIVMLHVGWVWGTFSMWLSRWNTTRKYISLSLHCYQIHQTRTTHTMNIDDDENVLRRWNKKFKDFFLEFQMFIFALSPPPSTCYFRHLSLNHWMDFYFNKLGVAEAEIEHFFLT